MPVLYASIISEVQEIIFLNEYNRLVFKHIKEIVEREHTKILNKENFSLRKYPKHGKGAHKNYKKFQGDKKCSKLGSYFQKLEKYKK